jgi:hypothetical protein
MSSRASVAIRLEIPERLLSERLSDWLAVLAVLTVGWVSARYAPPALSTGMAVSVASVLWLTRVRVAPVGGAWSVVPGPATRTLGPTVVLEARPDLPGRASARRLWLTRADLPADTLRRLAVSQPAVTRKSGS